MYRLNKALYGLKQIPRVWYEILINFLESHGFVRNKYDYGLYYKSGEIYITIYVDDLKFIDTDDVLIVNIKKLLSGKFNIKDLNPAIYYLRIKIVRTDTTIILRQTSYIDQVLKRYGIKNYKLVSTLINVNVRLCKADDKYILLKKNIIVFQSIFGSIIYVIY